MTPEEIYVSPDNEVLVTNFQPEFIDEDNKLTEAQYHLEIGRWYKVGEKSIAPNANDFIYVISEWREKQISKII